MKISVLTPSFNSGKYLQRAIESVLAQKYDNFEHIIIDGGSADNTLSTLQNYRHLLYISEVDRGQSDAMNKAFSRSTGDIIVYLNADDEFTDGAFENILQAFRENPQADMIVGNLFVSDAEKKIKRITSDKYKDILRYWLDVFPNNPVSYFYKREVQTAIGKFPIDDHYAMDFWFLLKAYRRFNIVKTDATLGIFHSDGNNKTARIDTGLTLHTTVKRHLWKEDQLMIPYFYSKLFWGRLHLPKVLLMLFNLVKIAFISLNELSTFLIPLELGVVLCLFR